MDADAPGSKPDASSPVNTDAPGDSTPAAPRSSTQRTGRSPNRATRSRQQLDNAHLGMSLIAKPGATTAPTAYVRGPDNKPTGEIVVSDVSPDDVERFDQKAGLKLLDVLSHRVLHALLLDRNTSMLDRGKIAVQIMTANRNKEVIVWDQRNKEDELPMEQRQALINEIKKWDKRIPDKAKQEVLVAGAMEVLKGSDPEVN